MNITYIAHTRFPTEKAHGVQMASVCNAMAALGHDVTLLNPTVWNSISKSAHEYYGLSQEFVVRQLASFDALKAWWVPNPLAIHIGMHSYRRVLREYFATSDTDLVYLRSPKLLAPALGAGASVVLELHTIPRFVTPTFVSQCNACQVVVCLTVPMRDALVSKGVDPDRLMVEGDGVDIERYRDIETPDEAKALWELPEKKPVVGYVGSLKTQDTIEKGVRELLGAFAVLKKKGVPFMGWIVGGTSGHIAEYQQLAHKHFGLTPADVRFEGRVSSRRVPSAVTACDVCVYPAPKSNHPFFLRDTSPLKLFEYFAAARPVVCADLPPLQGVVDSSVADMVPPGDVDSLAAAIEKTIDDPSIERLEQGLELAETMDWKARMGRIVSAVS